MSTIHENVENALSAGEVEYVVRDHDDLPASIESPGDFALALGIPQSQITKTLFLTEKSAGPRRVLLCCSSDSRVDFKAASVALGYGRLEVASPEALREVLGYPRNGVSPLGAPADVPVLLDEAVLRYSTVLVGGGATGVEVELSPKDLIQMTSAISGRFVKLPES